MFLFIFNILKALAQPFSKKLYIQQFYKTNSTIHINWNYEFKLSNLLKWPNSRKNKTIWDLILENYNYVAWESVIVRQISGIGYISCNFLKRRCKIVAFYIKVTNCSFVNFHLILKGCLNINWIPFCFLNSKQHNNGKCIVRFITKLLLTYSCSTNHRLPCGSSILCLTLSNPQESTTNLLQHECWKCVFWMQMTLDCHVALSCLKRSTIAVE